MSMAQFAERLQSLANEMTQIDGISVDSMKKYLKYPVLRSRYTSSKFCSIIKTRLRTFSTN